jgi:hypothetical protein
MPQDKKEVEDLLLNQLFNTAETSEGSDKAEDSDDDYIAAFAETINNDRLIDWRYWVQQMPVWTSSQAARLLCGLDPDVYESYESRPTRNDVSRPVATAKKMERLADAQGIHSLPPAKWLEWAVSNRFPVHGGLHLAMRSPGENDVRSIAEQAPTNAATEVVQQGLPLKGQAAEPATPVLAPLQQVIHGADAVSPDGSGKLDWAVNKPKRFQGYGRPLYDVLKKAQAAGQPMPSAHDVLGAFKLARPSEVIEVMASGIKYYDSNGGVKLADMNALRKAIQRMTKAANSG